MNERYQVLWSRTAEQDLFAIIAHSHDKRLLRLLPKSKIKPAIYCCSLNVDVWFPNY